MKREVYRKLVDWKNSKKRKPLMIYGARQVGKTYILKEFGRNEFPNFVYINCFNNPTVASFFKQDTDVHRIIRDLSVYADKSINPNETLLILDEIQDIPLAVSMLKYFNEEAPEYFVAAAGSLLGVINMKSTSFPTGNVDIIDMYPMTFHEFLNAMGQEKKADLLDDPTAMSSLNSLQSAYTVLLRQYYYVGGMPEAVKEFADSGDVDKVRGIQHDIITAYYSDIAKHAGKDALKARQVLQSIPMQLARQNKKFIFGAVKPGARAAEFEAAIQWLIDARMIYKVCRATKAELPLKFYLETDAFKLYLLDVGLLGAMVEAPASQVLIGDNIFKEYKGAFTENYVLEQMVTLPNVVIGYYNKENSSVEVDFLVQNKDTLIPIEVKAEENVKSKSFLQFITKDNAAKELKGLRLSMKGFIDQGWMLNSPLFAATRNPLLHP